jgi:hypothetical protein
VRGKVGKGGRELEKKKERECEKEPGTLGTFRCGIHVGGEDRAVLPLEGLSAQEKVMLGKIQ